MLWRMFFVLYPIAELTASWHHQTTNNYRNFRSIAFLHSKKSWNHQRTSRNDLRRQTITAGWNCGSSDGVGCTDNTSDKYTDHQQLWLDLRGTALFPNEAVRFIEDQCCRRNTIHSSLQFIDAVLVSSDMFDNIMSSSSSSSSMRQRPSTNEGVHEYNYRLYYICPNDDRIILHDPTTQQSIPIGNVVTWSEKNKLNIDVIELSERIMKEQQWLLLQEATGSTPQQSISKWMMKQFNDVIQFLSSSSSTSSLMFVNENNFEVSASGLLLVPQMNKSTPSTTSISQQQQQHLTSDADGNSSVGGIAIVCPDRTSFVNVDTVLAEFRNLEYMAGGNTGSMTVTTTLSGISIPSSTLQNNNTTARSNQIRSFVTAVVLPLDISIWETAFTLRGMEYD